MRINFERVGERQPRAEHRFGGVAPLDFRDRALVDLGQHGEALLCQALCLARLFEGEFSWHAEKYTTIDVYWQAENDYGRRKAVCL